MDCSCLSTQRRFHPRSVLSLLQYPTNDGVAFREGIDRTTAAVETDVIPFNGGGKTCRISGKGIYRALGVENIRHRRKANRSVVMRRLLSLDFVLEHPGLNWLPTEGEKVEFIEGLGVHSNLICSMIFPVSLVVLLRRLCASSSTVRAGAYSVSMMMGAPSGSSTKISGRPPSRRTSSCSAPSSSPMSCQRGFLVRSTSASARLKVGSSLRGILDKG